MFDEDLVQTKSLLCRRQGCAVAKHFALDVHYQVLCFAARHSFAQFSLRVELSGSSLNLVPNVLHMSSLSSVASIQMVCQTSLCHSHIKTSPGLILLPACIGADSVDVMPFHTCNTII